MASGFLSRANEAQKGINALREDIASTPRPKIPTLAPLPKPPKPPEHDPLQGFSGIAPLLAVLGGFLTRRPLVTSLNALAGSNNAFNQGQRQAYIDNLNAFVENADIIAAQNRQDIEQFNLVLNDTNLTVTQKVAALQSLGAEQRNDFLLAQDNFNKIATMFALKENLKARLEEASIAAKSRIDAAKITVAGKTKSTGQLEGQAIQDKFAEAEKQKGSLLNADEKLKIISQSKIPEQALFDTATAKFFAEQFLGGNKVGFQSFGFGSAGQANRNMVAREIVKTAQEKGLTPTQINAKMAEFTALSQGLAQTVKQGAQTQRFAIEADRQGQLVIDSFDGLDPSEFPLINRFRNIFLTQSGDPKVVRAAAAVNSFANTYGKTIQGGIGVPTDTARQHVYEILSLALNKEQMAAGVNQLRQEMQAAVTSPEDTAGILKLRLEGGKAAFNLPSLSGDKTPKFGSQQNPIALSDSPEKDQKFQLAPSGTFFLTTDGKLIRKR